MENEEIAQGKMIRPLVYITLLVGLLATIVASVIKLTLYVNSNEFVWKFPLELRTHRILTVTPRVPEVVEKTIILDYPGEVDTDVKKRICEVFGTYECKTAIAVALHEGLNHAVDDFNTNSNGSIDVGYFRINSVHFDKEGCSLSDVITEEGNIQCAFKLWKAQGWKIWVAYQNGSYLSSL